MSREEAWRELRQSVDELLCAQGTDQEVVCAKAVFADVHHLICTLDPAWRNRTPVSALRLALVEALDGWESLWRSDNNDEPPSEIADLRKLVQS